MNKYEVFGVAIVKETRSTIYEANSPEEALAMARKDIIDKSYPFMDWESAGYSTKNDIQLINAFLIN